MFTNECTGESHPVGTAPPAPLVRVEPPAQRSWAEKSAEEIIQDIRRFARNPGTI